MDELNIEVLIKKYDLYKGQLINYETLLFMYQEYSDKYTLLQFANILGINNQNLQKLKRKTITNNQKDAKVKILMNRKLRDEEYSLMILKLIQKYDLNKGKKIGYGFFKEIYQEVKTVLTEVEFANLLGILNSNLRNIRNTNQEAKIFMNIKLNDDKKEIIRKSIIEKYEGKILYYRENKKNKGEVDFLELYQKYKIYFTEIEFAQLLGMSEKNLWYTKNDIANPKIKDTEKSRRNKKRIGRA